MRISDWSSDVCSSDLLGVIYDVPAYRFVLRKAMELGGIYAYSYPPHTLLLAVPFSLFSYPVALALWTAVGAALFCHAARPYLSRVRLPMLVALIDRKSTRLNSSH